MFFFNIESFHLRQPLSLSSPYNTIKTCLCVLHLIVTDPLRERCMTQLHNSFILPCNLKFPPSENHEAQGSIRKRSRVDSDHPSASSETRQTRRTAAGSVVRIFDLFERVNLESLKSSEGLVLVLFRIRPETPSLFLPFSLYVPFYPIRFPKGENNTKCLV